MPGAGVEIGGSYSNPWVINNRGERFSWTGNGWREEPNFRRNGRGRDDGRNNGRRDDDWNNGRRDNDWNNGRRDGDWNNGRGDDDRGRRERDGDRDWNNDRNR